MLLNPVLRPLALVAMMAMFLPGCAPKEKDSVTPTSALTHKIDVRYEGVNLPSAMDARVQGGSTLAGGTKVQNMFDIAVAGPSTVNMKHMGTVTADREFYTTVTLQGLRPPATIPAGSYLTADIYVDGIKRKTARLDHTTTMTSSPTARISIQRGEW